MTVLCKVEWRATPDAPKPDVSFVPAMERRRLTGVERAALSVAHRALEQFSQSPQSNNSNNPNNQTIPVVFASRWGEIGTTVKLMQQMHADGEMSPAGFSNSVHNAAPGHLSLLTKNKAPYTAIAAGPDSYEMGLLEASTYPGKVLFVYAEEDTPEFYKPDFEDVQKAHAVAMVIDNGVN